MRFGIRPTLLLLLVIVADQLSKSWAVHNLVHHDIHIIGPVSLELSYNTGFAFSLGTGLGAILLFVIPLILFFMLYLFRQHLKSNVRFAVALVFGGALGNLFDRIFRHGGAVVDFIKVGVWPVFNLADSCIVIGILWIGIHYTKSENEKLRKKAGSNVKSDSSVVDGSES